MLLELQTRCTALGLVCMLLCAVGSTRAQAGRPNVGAKSVREPTNVGSTVLLGPYVNSQVRPQDQIFLISTRALDSQCWGADMSRLQCRRGDFCDDGCVRSWHDVPLDVFYAADDPDITTIVVVHGNRVQSGEDIQRGLMIYRALVRNAMSDAPVRLLIFSWPSSPIRGPLRDFRTKAGLADLNSHHLAWVLDQIAPDVPLAVFGYSYGARVINGALHLMGGGTLFGQPLDQHVHLERAPVRAVFLAAALDDNWLLPNQRHGMALGQIDWLLLITNRRDPAMKHYHFTDSFDRPQALGRHGVRYSAWLGGVPCRIEQIEACRSVGHHHALENYLTASDLMREAWRVVSFQDVASAARPCAYLESRSEN